jgi:beta-alanine degradation protein BauB
MFNKGSVGLHFAISGAMFALFTLGGIGAALAQTTPRSFVASPDVYKVIAQNDQYLVIEGTWQPGQRDQFHSHPAAATYFLTDCTLSYYYPHSAGSSRLWTSGTAFAAPPIESHSVENLGGSECKVIMFEPK